MRIYEVCDYKECGDPVGVFRSLREAREAIQNEFSLNCYNEGDELVLNVFDVPVKAEYILLILAGKPYRHPVRSEVFTK